MSMRYFTLAGLTAALTLSATAALAEGISTHVLDLARGVGGKDVPVTLEIKSADGSWRQVAKARTDENGRVRSFGDDVQAEAATYKLTFDISGYGETGATAFFPEIDVVFRVSDPTVHYHVPVVVSPFGYSTYRGN
jgi:5-hydroxyisourate hydrolase